MTDPTAVLHVRIGRPLRCNCCGKPVTAEPVRWCIACKLPIRQHDKFNITRRGLRHRHCRYPEMYLTPAEFRKRFRHEPY